MHIRLTPEQEAIVKAVAEMLKFVEANRITLDGVSVKELVHEGEKSRFGEDGETFAFWGRDA